jgi:hypothetical protein
VTDWLSPLDIATQCAEDMSIDDWRIVTTVAVILAESGGNPTAVGKPVYITGHGWAVAFGLCQLLSTYHVDRGPYPDVPRMTVAECFTPREAWRRMWLVMNRGRTGWSYILTPWSAFNPGPNGEPPAYKKHVPTALAAVNRLRADTGKAPLS